MAQPEMPHPKDIALLHVNAMGAAGNAAMAGGSFLLTGNAMLDGDYRKALVGAAVSIISGATSVYGIRNYLETAGPIIDVLYQASDVVEKSPPSKRVVDEVRREAALRDLEVKLREERAQKFNESFKVKKYEEGGPLQITVFAVTHQEMPSTTRSSLVKDMQYIDCMLDDMRVGKTAEATRYFRDSIQKRIRGSHRHIGKARNNWPEILDQAERDIRLLEDLDFDAATRLRSELENARTANVSWKK